MFTERTGKILKFTARIMGNFPEQSWLLGATLRAPLLPALLHRTSRSSKDINEQK